MNQRKLIIVEVKMADDDDFDLSQVNSLTIYQDSENHYHFVGNLKEIQRAIGDAIVHLGNNYRHPLIYDVQVIPGNEMDAVIASVDTHPNVHRRRRRSRR